MSTLIVDIETIAPDWSDLPAITRTALTHPINVGQYSETEKTQRKDAIQSRLALSPFTGSIVSLSVYDVERSEVAAYLVAESADSDSLPENVAVKLCSEAELLQHFWDGARSYDVFVTYNGRAFTLPFLLFRSVAQGVTPTIEIARQRYLLRQTPPYHVDLLDEFSNYGALGKRPSLALLCGAFRLPNPSILTGDEVAAAYKAGAWAQIVEKSVGDVETIAALYERWYSHLAPEHFKTLA
jgi:hypothetical protein